MIQNMDSLPWVADVYKRDLQIEKYFIGYLLASLRQHLHRRGCPGQCTFCLWPQTIGGTNTASAPPKMSPTKWPT
jgi:hypothetical protein